MPSLSVLFPFLDWWYQLREGTRDNIIGGLIVSILVGIIAIFWKTLARAFKRVFRTEDGSSLPQIVVNVPAITVPSQNSLDKLPTSSISAPLVPRAPAVGFVARRDKDGREIMKLLSEGLAPHRGDFIALWGEGGVGKTTLAAETVRELSVVYKQRIVWTSADQRADFTFSTFLDEIAIRLNREDLLRLAIGPKETEVRNLIACDPALIALDNFETIPSEEGHMCVEFLAKQSSCGALITTREMVTGARNIRIDAMSVSEALDFLERLIIQYVPHFLGLDRQRIIQVAAANPLVMDWIVAQLALAQSPDEVLDDLKHGVGDAAQRVFDRSFNLPQLGDDGRTALLALSLFVPSASRSALGAVAGFGTDSNRLNEAVKRLAALRLVNTTQGGERLFVQGLTRELAIARLEKY